MWLESASASCWSKEQEQSGKARPSVRRALDAVSTFPVNHTQRATQKQAQKACTCRVSVRQLQAHLVFKYCIILQLKRSGEARAAVWRYTATRPVLPSSQDTLAVKTQRQREGAPPGYCRGNLSDK